MKVLKCNISENKRFNSLYAKVSVHGDYDTIENHFQKSKVFEIIETGEYVMFDTSTKAKAAQYRSNQFNLIGFKFYNGFLPTKYLNTWYKALWAKYIKNNQYLLDEIYKYDSFVDSYSRKDTIVTQNNTVFTQVDVIKEFRYNDFAKLYENIMNEAKDCFSHATPLPNQIVIY